MKNQSEVRRAGIWVGALILDLALGDPPNRFHPVAWMGSIIDAAYRGAPRKGCLAQLTYGGLLAIGGTLATFGLGRLLERVNGRLPSPLDWLVESVILKSTFSVRRLSTVARQIGVALEEDVSEARRLVSWHLVSRDTSMLGSAELAAATVESVAESASDGVFAPMLAYAFFGMPGPLAYRFVNTTDSMLGYRDEAREWLGKVPARLDDLVNLVPARLTAFLITLAAALVGESWHNAWRIWRRDAGKTTSPNAGHPMSAMSGALGIELEKIDHYRLGSGQRQPEAKDLRRALRVTAAAVRLGTAVLIACSVLRHIARRD